ncbi:MAG: ATP-binding protein [Acidobacteriota bacterium]
MRLFRFERARTHLALSGALVSAIFLSLLALGARTLIRRLAFNEIDGELYTLAIAIGSDYELVGLPEEERQALKAGLEANAFEFRLANHSAILFNGEVPVALTGNLLPEQASVTITPYRNHPEIPYTAIESYSGQNRTCRFLVTHLQGKAKGATLVLFRWIGPALSSLARVDQALAGMVLIGFLGTAAILAFAVARAIRPVEEVTRLAEEAEATDLSRRVSVTSGGKEFRRLADVINSLFDRLERAFVAQRRLISDAAHELKTPTAVLVGEAQDALRAEATPEERRKSLETIAEVSRGLAREVDGLLHLAKGDAATPRRIEGIDLAEIAEQALLAAASLGAQRGVVCVLSKSGEPRLRGERAGLLRLASNLIGNAVLYTEPNSRVEVRVGAQEGGGFVEVADRGPGVAPEDRARIFERFVRLEEARLRNPQGSGLGLAIVDQVVQAHGGVIEVRAHEGGGSVFRVTLPALR